MCEMCELAAMGRRRCGRWSSWSSASRCRVTWRGALVGHDVAKLRSELEASRDYVYERAGFARDPFGA